MFCIGQLIAGCGAGACSVIPRAISKDKFLGNLLVKAISYISIASTIATGIAPILGSALQGLFGWRSVFLCLIALTITSLILVVFFISETIKKISAPVKWQIAKRYEMLFSNRRFLAYTALNACAYAGIIIYLMLSPFLFQTLLTYSAGQNSLIYLLCASSYLLGNLLLGRLIEKLNAINLMWLGVIIIAAGSIFVIISTMLQEISAIGLILCGLLIHFGSGLITPMTYKQILSIPEFSAGISSGAINATRVLIAFIASLFAATFSLQNATVLACLLGMLSLISLGISCLISTIISHELEVKLL
jgi:predicted MFS family arabinose efflux permease